MQNKKFHGSQSIEEIILPQKIKTYRAIETQTFGKQPKETQKVDIPRYPES